MNKKPFKGTSRGSKRTEDVSSQQTKDAKSSRKSSAPRKSSAYRSERSSSSRDARIAEKPTRTLRFPTRNTTGRITRDSRESSRYPRSDSKPRAPYSPRLTRDSYASRPITHVTSSTPSSRPRFESSQSVPESKKPQTKSHKLKATSTSTSWGSVASWYNDHLEKTGDTYHEKVIYPNLLRIIGDIKGKKILDLACGQGQFSRLMRDQGAHITGIDLGKELIAIAESHNVSVKEAGTHKAMYVQGSADDLHMLKDETFDSIVCILALQNIENLQKTIEEAKRVLAPSGSFVFVLNHPSFRNPKQSYWGYDENSSTQFRRVDEYMTESHYKIDMTPGSATNKKFTVSFHRPLQIYVKALSKVGLSLTRLEEWISHKESEKGPHQKAENKSRKEIPLFMCIEGRKTGN